MKNIWWEGHMNTFIPLTFTCNDFVPCANFPSLGFPASCTCCGGTRRAAMRSISFFSRPPSGCSLCVWADRCALFGRRYCSRPAGFASQVSASRKWTKMPRAVLDVEDQRLACYSYPLSTLIMEKRRWWLLCLFSLSPTLWLRGVGGVEVLIGNCRPHCLHIHGFLDWSASGYKTHTHMWYVSLALTHAHSQPKPISILKSPYLCWGHEYSWSTLRSTHLWVEVTVQPVWENMIDIK